MKNIYIYGYSDDLHEVETDYGAEFEAYGDIDINGVIVRFSYEGDWKLKVEGEVPPGWAVRHIKGNDHFVHIQVPTFAVDIVFRDLYKSDWD